MEELLSLKWNNHRKSFLQLLSVLRKKNTYTDATIACGGQLYKVHKMVLSACSDYFSTIFDSIACPNPVIILKDISASNLEALLDYMYLGEVSVRQTDLSSLIQAAECLQLRGLAVPDDDTNTKSDRHKRLAESSSPSSNKKSRKSRNETSVQQKTASDDVTMEETKAEPKPIPIQCSIKDVVSLKMEEYSDVAIKEERPKFDEDYFETWDFNEANEDSSNFDQNQHEVEDASGYDDLQPSVSDPFAGTEDLNSDMSLSFDNEHTPSSSSQHHGKKMLESARQSRNKCCMICNKTFGSPAELARHIRIHTGEKPFACPHCSYRANQNVHLSYHVIAHHNKALTE